MKYKFEAGSPSDPAKAGLGFHTREKAEAHAQTMNELLEQFDDPNAGWNKSYWKSKPENWVVKEL